VPLLVIGYRSDPCGFWSEARREAGGFHDRQRGKAKCDHAERRKERFAIAMGSSSTKRTLDRVQAGES
jgi:hypothetical protein